MNAPEKIWIIVPVYLDVESFLILKAKICHHLKTVATLKDVPVTYVVVDDSGGIDPAIEALFTQSDIKVIACPFNLGHQRALVYGLRTLAPQVQDTDLLITLDSDGEDQPEDLSALVKPLFPKESGQGSALLLKRISLARRTKRQEPPFFKILYSMFKFLFRLATGVLIRTGNFAAYRGWLAKNVLFHPHFDLSYSSSLVSLNLDTALVPCYRGKRYAGKSRMGYLKLFIHGIRMFMPFLDRIAVRAILGFSFLLGLTLCTLITLLILQCMCGYAFSSFIWMTLIIMFMLLFITLGNFLILFAIFSQSQGLALRRLDQR